MEEEKEPLTNFYEYRDFIQHIHVADTNRLAPGTGMYPYPEFVRNIHKANYDGRISIECNWRNFAEEIDQHLIF